MGSITGNRYFNDPNLGVAFNNLAGVFAPPGGSDLSGYANAAATKEKASRLAELFAYAKDPAYNQTQADRMGVLAGLYAPNQSYYSVDQGNMVTMRGQDVSAKTSIFNNNADNATILQQNAANNERALATNKADNERSAFTSLYATPIGQNEMLPAVPADVATKYNLPARDPVIGAIMAGQGDTVTLPDGRVVKGADKPMTEEQVKGTILQTLPASDQRNVVTSSVPVETIIGPDGKTPTVVNRQDAVNKPAYVKSSEPTEIEKLQQLRDALPPGDPRRREIDQRIQALGRGQQQSQYDKTNDEALAKLNDEISTRAMSSFADKSMLTTLRTALNDPNADQGALGATNLALKKYLNAFGIDAGNTSSAEMVNALGNQLALRLRDPSNGAGMPGALSDSDREFLKSMVASLGNSPEANQKIVDYYMALQEKNIDLDALRQNYIAKNGRLDDGFRAQMADYLRQRGLGTMPTGSTDANPTSPSATVEQATVPKTATNPQTGEKLILQNGQWVPAQ